MDKEDIRILLVDDHQVVREGLQHMLEQEEDMEVVGQGESSEEALFMADVFSPNIVLMDIKMPVMDGMTALPLLLARAQPGQHDLTGGAHVALVPVVQNHRTEGPLHYLLRQVHAGGLEGDVQDAIDGDSRGNLHVKGRHTGDGQESSGDGSDVGRELGLE